MNLKKNTLPIAVGLVFTLVIGGIYYFYSQNKATETAEVAQEGSPDKTKGRYQLNSNTLPESGRHDEAASKEVETLSANSGHSSPHTSDDSSDIEDETSKQMEKVFKGYIKEVYSDLFDELNLDTETRKALTAHLVKNHQLQQKISMMLLDENVSNEEILAKQNEYFAKQEEEVKRIMSKGDQLQKLQQYNDRLPMKIAGETVDSTLEGVKGIDANQKREIRNIILKHDFAGNNVANQLAKSQGNPLKAFNQENIADGRNLVKSTANNDPAPLREITKELGTTNQNIDKELRSKGFPKEAINAVMNPRISEERLLKNAVSAGAEKP